MSEKKIKIIPNGPFLIEGNIPLKEFTIAYNENGYYYENEKVINAPDNYALCRCGKSNNKPFCDGTHSKIDFNGKSTASREKFMNETKKYENKNFILYDNEKLCAFARFCHSPNTDVWELMDKNMDKNDENLAIKLASDCPSGRLVMFDKNTNEAIEPILEKEIILLKDPMQDCDGPIWVKGGISIEDEKEYVYEIRNRVTLCRCGKSNNKPFCDSNHLDTN